MIRIYVELKRDRDVTIFVTCRIYSTTHDISILVSIIPYSRSKNQKLMNVST